MFTRDVRHLWTILGGLVLVVVLFLAARSVVVPPSHGQFGPYRGEALAEAAARQRIVPAASECLECHEDQAEQFAESAHREVQCMQCHGLATEHIVNCRALKAAGANGKLAEDSGLHCDDGVVKIDDLRGACEHCHSELVGRPRSHPVIDTAEHLEEEEPEEPESRKVCSECHVAHQPSEQP